MKSDISLIIYNETYLDQSQADELAGLIADWVEGGRCEWTKCLEDGNEYYITSCDMVDTAYHTYCPKCGRKIGFAPNERGEG
ncbi:MAG: hypothetical protein ABFD82_00680 [Syntrophaceae bacterium]